jgi:hypothetical protein
MPGVLPGGFQGSRFRAPGQKSWLTRPQGPLYLSHPPGLPSAHPTPALVAHTQGGITLSLEEGESSMQISVHFALRVGVQPGNA